MDTRNKILTPSEALARLQDRRCSTTLKVVTGYFDPLLATHARRLSEIAGAEGGLIVVIGEPDRPILPQRARAELVAALASVGYVVMAGQATEEFLSKLPAAQLVREDQADAGRAKEFILYVLDKQMVSQG